MPALDGRVSSASAILSLTGSGVGVGQLRPIWRDIAAPACSETAGPPEDIVQEAMPTTPSVRMLALRISRLPAPEALSDSSRDSILPTTIL